MQEKKKELVYAMLNTCNANTDRFFMIHTAKTIQSAMPVNSLGIIIMRPINDFESDSVKQAFGQMDDGNHINLISGEFD